MTYVITFKKIEKNKKIGKAIPKHWARVMYLNYSVLESTSWLREMSVFKHRIDIMIFDFKGK